MDNKLKVFKFLKEMYGLKYPVILNVNDQKNVSDIKSMPKSDYIYSIYNSDDSEKYLKNIIFEIERPEFTSCPKPPQCISEWVMNNWKDFKVSEVKIKPKLTYSSSEGTIDIHFTPKFDDSNKRVLSLKLWLEKRKKWLKEEIEKNKVMKYYNNYFDIYSNIRSNPEKYDVILGDGMLHWKNKDINHPIVLQKLEVELDTNKPSIKLLLSEDTPILYSELFRKIDNINQDVVSDVISLFNNQDFHISDIVNASYFYKETIVMISAKGKFCEEFESLFSDSQIYIQPKIFLRDKSVGYSDFVDTIIENFDDIDKKSNGFWETLVGNYKKVKTDKFTHESSLDNNDLNGIDKNIYFSLPANKEQMSIVKKLSNSNGLVVQGPPGTGKTHTIANLIGHYLTQGKKILVTSESEKALNVLKEQLFDGIKNLSVQYSSNRSRSNEIKNTIKEIDRRTSLNYSKNEIKNLIIEREKLIDLLLKLRKNLYKAHSIQYKDLIFNNTTIYPTDAAKFINRGTGELDYIPLAKDNEDMFISLPLSKKEIEFLYSSNDFSLEEISILENCSDIINELWDYDAFKSKVEEYRKLEKVNDNNKLRELNKNLKINFNMKKKHIDKWTKEIDEFDDNLIDIVNSIIKNPIKIEIWDDYFRKVEIFCDDFKRIDILKHKYKLDFISKTLSKKEIYQILEKDIIERKIKKINLFNLIIRPKLKSAIKSITLNGNEPTDIKNLEVAHKLIEYELEFNKLIKELSVLTNKEYINSIFINVENKIERLNIIKNKLLFVVNWYEKFSVLFKEEFPDIRYLISREDLITTASPITKIEKMIYNIKNQLDFIKIINDWDKKIEILQQNKNYCDLTNKIHRNYVDKNFIEYESNYKTLEIIVSKMPLFKRRNKLLGELKQFASKWTESLNLKSQSYSIVNLDKLDEAWKFRQLKSQINYINSLDINQISKDIERTNNKLLKITKEIIEKKAWKKKKESKTLKENHSISGLLEILKQIGKSKGKKARHLRPEVRKKMKECQSAIPVWIMPLNDVYSNFNPIENKFDLVIIDEASQANILALAALFLGKKVIIVGDDEQVSPVDVGIKLDDVKALQKQFLPTIPNNVLYNFETSIYNLAKAMSFKPVVLNEHFRSLPEIIGFSNELSYDYNIIPLRDNSNVKIKPPIINYRVPDGIRAEDKILNKKEAEHIVSLIKACIERKEYKDMTFGVITMKGHEQYNYIEKLLRDKIKLSEYKNRRILCGNSATFQGDERDVIFISLIDSSEDGPISLISPESYNYRNKKSYNVAASRAKNQMWVVHSINVDKGLKKEDIRYKLLNYLDNPDKLYTKQQLSKTDSEFEVLVIKQLAARNYNVISQYEVGSYRIDIVVYDDKNKIAIECDGEKYHTKLNLEDDINRQLILERLGWRFIRIRGNEYFSNPDECIKNVIKKIDSYGIMPTNMHEKIKKKDDTQLLQTIKDNAAIIREKWNNDLENESDTKMNFGKNKEKIKKEVGKDSKEKVEYEQLSFFAE